MPDVRSEVAAARLRAFAREHAVECRVLSEGDGCECALCLIDLLAARCRGSGAPAPAPDPVPAGKTVAICGRCGRWSLGPQVFAQEAAVTLAAVSPPPAAVPAGPGEDSVTVTSSDPPSERGHRCAWREMVERNLLSSEEEIARVIYEAMDPLRGAPGALGRRPKEVRALYARAARAVFALLGPSLCPTCQRPLDPSHDTVAVSTHPPVAKHMGCWQREREKRGAVAIERPSDEGPRP